MSKTKIEQVSETVTIDLDLANQTSSEVDLQQAEVHQEQAISELEKRLVQEAVSAVEETKKAITRPVAFGSQLLGKTTTTQRLKRSNRQLENWI